MNLMDSDPDVQHLNGVPWHDAPAPVRFGHKHWAQTHGWIGFDQIRRCPCGAVSMRPEVWFHPFERDERWAASPVVQARSLWQRIIRSR